MGNISPSFQFMFVTSFVLWSALVICSWDVVKGDLYSYSEFEDFDPFKPYMENEWENAEVKSVTDDTTTEETTIPPTSEETTLSITEETTMPPTTEEEETTHPPTTEETTAPPTTEEEETTHPPTTEETTAPPTTEEEETTPPPTTEETTPPPTTEETTVPPTTEETTPPPTTEVTTPPPTTEETTPPPTTEETTPTPTTEGTTMLPTTTETTPTSTTEETTPPPTTEETTSTPTTEGTTMLPTTTETTPTSTTEEHTTPPTTEETTAPPSTAETTTPPTTEETTVPPTTAEITTPPTSEESTAPPTTAEATAPTKTEETTSTPTTEVTTSASTSPDSTTTTLEPTTVTTTESTTASTTPMPTTPLPTTLFPTTPHPTTPLLTSPLPTTPLSTSPQTTFSTSPTYDTTTLTTSSSTTTLPSTCPVQCSQTDRYGHLWRICANSVARTDCSILIPNSVGQATWRCSINGEFETPNPNVSSCRSSWIGELEEEARNITDFDQANKVIEDLSNITRNSNRTYFGHEIRNVTRMTGCVILKSREYSQNFTSLEETVKTAVNLNSYLIRHREPWTDLNAIDRSSISSDILESMDGVLFQLTDAVEGAKNYRQTFFMENETDLLSFLIFAETFDKEKGEEINQEYEFPPKEHREQKSSFIKLPEGWKDLLEDDKVEIGAMSIDPEYIGFIMPGQYANLMESRSIDGNDKLINGRLISLSLSSPVNDACGSGRSSVSHNPRVEFRGKGAEITFQHDIEAWGEEQQVLYRRLHEGEKPRAVLGSAQCVYWDTDKNVWSSNGCKILRSNRFETVCECSHLTSFAVLMDVHQYVGKELALELLTLTLCPTSEVALALSILILSSVNGLQRLRSLITTNLSICLLVGNALVLFVLDRNYFNMGEGVCVGAAMITHYVFLSAFMWMLVEGIQLYRMVVHVFESGRSYIMYFALLAYGSPLIIIAVTATIGYSVGDRPYGGDVYCWLEGPYIWSFMGPVALIIFVNTIILFIALRKAYILKHTENMSPSPIFRMGRIRSGKKWFKGCFSLTVILGLTWTVGFFSIMKGTSGVVFAYVFTILNASQGIFIFLFNCVLNDKVRAFAKRKVSVFLPSWGTSSSISPNTEDKNAKDGSIYGERRLSQFRYVSDVNLPNEAFTIPSARIANRYDREGQLRARERGLKADVVQAKNEFSISAGNVGPQRRRLGETNSSQASTPAYAVSDNVFASHSSLISLDPV